MSEAESNNEAWDVLVEELCARRPYFLGLFSFAVVFLLLQIPYLFVADPNSTLYAIGVLNVVGTTAFVFGFGSVLWLCRGRVV